MARALLAANELDENFRIEAAIQQTLATNKTAEIAKYIIDERYDIVDDDEEPIQASVQEKCSAIAQKLGAKFKLSGDDAVFRSP